MNFWTFKEDHSRGYYDPVSNKAARDHGGQLVYVLFYLVIGLFKLAGYILLGFGSLVVMAVRQLRKLKR